MKLLTHNMLQCHIKGVKNGYPLKIEAEKVCSWSCFLSVPADGGGTKPRLLAHDNIDGLPTLDAPCRWRSGSRTTSPIFCGTSTRA